MVTPQYLESIEFNKITDLYNKLNVSITSDIIRRINAMGDISSTTKKQLDVMVQTNGIKIFNSALLNTASLSAETRKALKELYSQMASKDIQGYKELYDYRNKPFKLSLAQYQILNQATKQTFGTLKNMTNTIAFSSKQLYVDAVDKAYMKVVSGAFDYNTAIKDAIRQVAEQGITLKDKAGRNTQLDVAIRRNVLGGIQQTANDMNRDIEANLGCNGYEVTAHIGARPTHAMAQGRQYALTQEDATKYHIGLWSEVSYLWEEYNCRHTYFGIILGISDRQYSNSELTDFKDATVTMNGEEVPYYQATQQQRQIENNIRNTKRTINTLNEAGQDSSDYQTKLKQYNNQYNQFCNETGLDKQSERTRIIS